MRLLFCRICLLGATASPPASEIMSQLETVQVTRSPEVPSFHNSSWTSPVPKPASISSPFGPRWKISSDRYDFHRGIDYFDEDDTELYAIADGVVFQHREFTDGGTTTVIEHELENPSDAMFHDRKINKVFSYYNHLNSRTTTEGQAVQKGEVIGRMGQTGSTTFTHLHFTTRLVGYCTLQYQVANNRVPTASSECATGFDPAVHPYLFVGAEPRLGLKELYEIQPKNSSFAFAVRYNTSRGHLDLDVIETDFGKISFNTRAGIWGKQTIEGLDDLDNITSWMSLNPGIFRSTTPDEIYYEMHFFQKPAYLEVLDIYGEGIRWNAVGSSSSSSSSSTSSSSAEPTGAGSSTSSSSSDPAETGSSTSSNASEATSTATAKASVMANLAMTGVLFVSISLQ
ncbi:Uncharacterized metalloprotease HI_0409 [Durusdinium trenchii]|uniref:Uncharacterized metalloprotease HI_0409 n=1 Tax=Durusdinium trenchii TaxID=1381693 RepID=A0ABP0L3S0_9DINO